MILMTLISFVMTNAREKASTRQKVPLHKCQYQLQPRAKDLGFPTPLVRLAIAMYTGPRWLYTKEGIANPISPNRGIAAGCSLATTLVKVYYLVALDRLNDECILASKPHLGKCFFDAYIDDFQISSQGTEGFVYEQS